MKKGFTLIELLAVIVILAIIALIATPIVLNIINDTKESATLRSADFYLDAVNYAISTRILNGTTIEDGTYDILESGNICIGTLEDKVCKGEILEIKVNGQKPNGDKITIKDGQIVSHVIKFGDVIVNSGDEGPLMPHFGKSYCFSPNKGFVISIVFAEDGSALNNMYGDGELLGSDSAEAGTFSYEDGYVIMANGEKATVSADRTQIDMGDGMVWILVEPVPGLYETGTIAALKSGDFSVLSNNLLTPWDQLVADGHVERGSNPGVPKDATRAALAGDLICPETMTQIEDDEFSNCENLTGIMTLGTVTKIGKYAFFQCSNLEIVFVPHNEIKYIGESAFQSCTRLTDVKILAHVESIFPSVFAGCTSIESITIGDGTTSIGRGAFSGCSLLSNVTIPASVSYLADGCFQNCLKLTNITYGGTVDQWNNLIKSNKYWNVNCGQITVTCTGDANGNGSGTVVVPAWSL